MEGPLLIKRQNSRGRASAILSLDGPPKSHRSVIIASARNLSSSLDLPSSSTNNQNDTNISKDDSFLKTPTSSFLQKNTNTTDNNHQNDIENIENDTQDNDQNDEENNNNNIATQREYNNTSPEPDDPSEHELKIGRRREKLLLEILNDAIMCVAFRRFLFKNLKLIPQEDKDKVKEARKLIRSLEFWLEIENYKYLLPKNSPFLEQHARAIYIKHFSEDSRQRISIPMELKDQLEEIIITDNLLDLPQGVSPSIYDQVQLHLFDEMKGILPQFVASDFYLTVKARKVRKRAIKAKNLIKKKLQLRKKSIKATDDPETLNISSRITYPKSEKEALEIINIFVKEKSSVLVLEKLGLDTIPIQIDNFYLTYLDLTNNCLTSMSAQVIINNLAALKELYLDFNYLTYIPKEIVFCQHLKVLSVNYNELTHIPTDIGKIETLRYLGVKGNKHLEYIPPSVSQLSNLEELRHDPREYDIPTHILRSNAADREKWVSVMVEYLEFIEQFEVHIKQKSHWVPDKERPSCIDCNESFGNLNRRHHCRLCGEVFCSNCSHFKSVITYLNYPKVVRVCDLCFIVITTSRKKNETSPVII